MPLKHAFVALFARTLGGAAPTLERADEPDEMRGGAASGGGGGAPPRISAGSGWPCQVYPEGWLAEAGALLERFDTLVGEAMEHAREWSQTYHQFRGVDAAHSAATAMGLSRDSSSL